MICLLRIHRRNSVSINRFLYPAISILVFLSSCGIPSTNTPTSTLTPIPPSETFTASYSPTVAATQTPYIITATLGTGSTTSKIQGTFFLSLADANHFHLFAFSPQSLPLTRLTANAWDDITPALSPDGKLLAFASNRNSYWDLYLLELSTGKITRLTDTPEFDAAPSWSPDGAFLTYESFQNDNLDVCVRSISDSVQVYNLTQGNAANTFPVWSPHGRQIAFSPRCGLPTLIVRGMTCSPMSVDLP
jgi:TolB protein